MSPGLLPRLLLGLVLAAVVTFALHLWVGRDPDHPPPVLPAPPEEGPGPAPGDDDAAGREILDALHGEALLVYMGLHQEKLPADAAPVLTIRPGGAIHLTVPPPLHDHPGPEVWPKLGVLLPRERLVRLTPRERSSLLRIWSAVAADGWLRERQVVATDLDYRPEELAPLLKRQRRWQ